jgi:hypothetical protein
MVIIGNVNIVIQAYKVMLYNLPIGCNGYDKEEETHHDNFVDVLRLACGALRHVEFTSIHVHSYEYGGNQLCSSLHLMSSLALIKATRANIARCLIQGWRRFSMVRQRGKLQFGVRLRRDTPPESR